MFLSPWMLILLLALPLVLYFYKQGLRRRAKYVIWYADLALTARALSKASRFKHVASFLYFLALVVAIIALARPTLPSLVANSKAGIILAIDTSRSMRQNDVKPSRFDVARNAVKAFVDDLPKEVRIGLVNFGAYASLSVPLTDNHEEFLGSLERLQLIRGTAIGEALLANLKAFPELSERKEESDHLTTIILPSDGRNRSGQDPLSVLEEVKKQDVTVHTIGVGTATSNLNSGEFFSSRGGFDEATLRTIASKAGGEYVFVDSVKDLETVYKDFSNSLAWRVERNEATALLSLIAAFLLMISLSVSNLRQRVV